MQKINKHPILYDLNLSAGKVNNVIGLLNQHEMSIIEIKILQALVHASMGIWNSATPSNPKEVANGATAVFWKVKNPQWKERTLANRFETKSLYNRELAKKSNVKEEIKVGIEIDKTDLDGISTREQYLAHVLGMVMTTLTANMDAIYLEVFVLDAQEKHKSGDDSQLSVNPDWISANTKEQYDKIFLQAFDLKVNIARKLTQYDLGSDERDYGVILHKLAQGRLLLAMPKAGDTATNVGREMVPMEGTYVAGLGMMTDHLYLNQLIAAGQAFREDKAYDFRNVIGVIAHKEAAFVAVQRLHSANRINGDGNQEYIYRVRYFQDMIRDQLYGLMVLDTNFGTNTPTSDVQKDVNDVSTAIAAGSPYTSTKAYADISGLTGKQTPTALGITLQPSDMKGTTTGLDFSKKDDEAKTITYSATTSKTGASPKTTTIVIKGSDATLLTGKK